MVSANYNGKTLDSIFRRATAGVISYEGCAQLLEQQLQQMFPWIDPHQIYVPVRERSQDVTEYCRNLLGIEKIFIQRLQLTPKFDSISSYT